MNATIADGVVINAESITTISTSDDSIVLDQVQSSACLVGSEMCIRDRFYRAGSGAICYPSFDRCNIKIQCR